MKRSLPIQSTTAATPWLRRLGWWASWLGGGALLIALLYQVPARHVVRVGLDDAAYVQGFADPVNRWGVIDPSSAATTPLRWTRAQSYLIFPQIGLPATATIRWRALRSPGEPPPTVRVLLNGRDELGVFTETGDWETHSFAITGGALKPNDLFLELRTEPPAEIEGETRGVQVAEATLATASWPVRPYPAQLLYGALAIAFGAALAGGRRRQWVAAIVIGLAFLLLYRLQLTPYPLRTLPPTLVLALSALLLIRALPTISATVPRAGWRSGSAVLGALAIGLTVLWAGWLLRAAEQHVVLSVPGVEKDFRVFATRAQALSCPAGVEWATASCVLRADGFYQLGYPLLLWLVKPLTSLNAFLAARLVGALAGVGLLLATWALGRRLYGAGAALLALALLALSPLTVQYGLYLGTDMAFVALWIGGLAALLAPRAPSARSVALAGLLCGLAFIIRHPGLVLLPFGWAALVALHAPPRIEAGLRRLPRSVPWRLLGWFTLGWMLAALPQIAVNLWYAGAPLYSQQAKNIWLAVYGNTDWGRWEEAANSVPLRAIVLADPPRFFGSWSRNLQAFLGTGAQDTSEFGQAIALRLLPFPANWLAIGGLGLWVWRGGRRERLLAAGAALYVLGVTVGFVLPRFFLPLAPIWALAAVAPVLAAARLAARRWPRLDPAQWLLVSGLVLAALMARGPQIGAGYVLDHQDADAALVARTLLPLLAPEDRILFALPPEDMLGKYSALAHRAAPPDAPGARYVVWSAAAGAPPALVAGRAPLAAVGPYTIVRIP